jgi:hypothetical protein
MRVSRSLALGQASNARFWQLGPPCELRIVAVAAMVGQPIAPLAQTPDQLPLT